MTAREGAGDRAELLKAQAALYGLVARIFGAIPSPELVAGIKDRPMLDALEPFGLAFDEDFLGAGAESQAEELAIEFTRLFTGPGTHIAAFESVYVRGQREQEPQLWGQAAVEVAAFYRELGFELREGQMPDHLSLELQAMAVMSQCQGDWLESGDEATADRLAGMQERFCREHLRQWIPAVCRDIGQETGSSFYRSMAALVADLVEITCGSDASESDGQAISGNIQEEEALNEDT